ncbi:uncharacterized protein LOC135686190 [Rhopilema esculentum]|uniref:uncharacterized protein LOC135686190 n=1 Tax=Rhopilema esculentum TaxID=499914 RepID=UPI0031D9E483
MIIAILLLVLIRNIKSLPSLPAPDDNLNIFMLPMGDGDSTIVQCPTGTLTVINLGSVYTSSYWNENDVGKFIPDLSRVENIIITRPHPSCYNLLPLLFEDTKTLKKVYIACSIEEYIANAKVKRWISKLRQEDKIIEVKSKSTGTRACLGDDCTNIKLCSDSPFLDAKIVAANLGGCSVNNVNMKSNSMVFQIKFYDFNMIMPGDIEDPSVDTSVYLKQVIAGFTDPEDLQATVYQAAGHGAWGRTNKYFFVNAIKPQYVVIGNSAPRNDSTNSYVPRCELLYYLSQREKASVIDLQSTQSFQCVWADGSVSITSETKKALFLTAFDVNSYKVRRILHISSDGEKHKVTHLQVPLG